MPRPTIDVNGPEYQAILREREMHRRYGANYHDMKWAEETLMRLEEGISYGGYTDKDCADLEKIKQIYARVFSKTAET